ncbi:MAG: hypothetical protein U0807_18190 [Candidatus Binatia bacterium]
MVYRGGRLAVVAGIAGVLTAGPALATRKPRVSCTAGQYLIEGTPLTVGTEASEHLGHALVLADGQVSIPGVCPPTAAHLRPGRRGMRLTAHWTDCDGISGKVRLRGRTDASCSRFAGRLRLPHHSKSMPKGGEQVKGVLDQCFFIDPGVQQLEDGQEAYAAQQCTATVDDLLKVLDSICQTLQGKSCANTSATCGRRAQEIFTGVSLFPSATTPASWNHFGGRGEIMADAGLCIMKDLANGPHVNSASADIGIGNVAINQKVGFLAYDLAQRTVTAYQNLDFCVPVFGCLTGVGQKIGVHLASSCPAHPVGRSCGTYPVKAAHALDVVATESSRYLGLEAPVITLVTPYGPINVRPQIQFWSKLGMALSPYGTSPYKDHTSAPLDYRVTDPVFGFFADLADRYGRTAGVLFSSQPWSLTQNVGWDSQIGLGSRDARPWTSAWSPGADPKPARPDHNLGTARSDSEKEASAHLHIEAEFSYSPTELLPSWLKGSGVDLSFKIWVTPKADARVAGQLAFYASEGSAYKVDNAESAYTQLVVRDGATAAGSFEVDAGMDLVAYIDLPSPLDDITLVDVHPDLSIPVTKKDDDSQESGQWREARAGSGSRPPDPPAFDGPVRTFHGDVDGAAFVSQCLAEPVPEQTKDEPSFSPGDPNALKKDILYPCNICLGVGEHHVEMCVPQPGHTTAECTVGPRCHPALIEAGKCKDLKYDSTPQTTELYPSTSNPLPASKHWDCDSYGKSGCMDLCAWNPLTHALTVAKSAVDLMPAKGCGIPVPK